MSIGRVLYQYDAQEPDELNVLSGNVLELLSLNEDGWWLAKSSSSGKIGLIPGNYVCLEQHSSKQDPLAEQKILHSKPSPVQQDDLKRIKEMRLQADMKIESIKSTLSTIENKPPYSSDIINTNRTDSASSTANNPIVTISASGRKEREITRLAMQSSIDYATKESITSSKSNRNIVDDITKYLRTYSNNSDLDIAEQRLVKQLNHILIQFSKDERQQDYKKLSHESEGQNNNHNNNNHININSMESPATSSSSVAPSPSSSSSPVMSNSPITQQQQRGGRKEIPSKKLFPSIVIPPTATSSAEYTDRGPSYGDSAISIPSVPLPFISKLQPPSSSRHSTGQSQSQPNAYNTAAASIASGVEIAEGMRYPQCRSIVYPPSNYSEQRYQTDAPKTRLRLQHVHGYDGDYSRHADASAIRGKNVIVLKNNIMMFPAAALVVIMDTTSLRQSFFSGHSEEVTCLEAHGDGVTVASGQIGKTGKILVWNSSTLLSSSDSYSENCMITELYMQEEVRGVYGLSFSGDGRFLVALGLEDTHIMTVFDWAAGSKVASAKIGHQDVCQMGFNAFLYSSIDRVDDHQVHSVSSPRQQKDAPSQGGCYTLISCGGKQVKFWTLKRVIVDSTEVEKSTDSKGFKVRNLPGNKYKHNNHHRQKYELIGNVGVFPKKQGNDIPDFLCFNCVNDDKGKESRNLKPTSRIFTGTSSGCVYIWHVFEEGDRKGKGDRDRDRESMSWLPKGRLISVVTDVHDQPILDMHYLFLQSDELEQYERVATCSKDGSISVWCINRTGDEHSLPIDFESTANLHLHSETTAAATESTAFGRSISWNTDGKSLIVGTTQNMILSVSGMSGEMDAQVSIQSIVRGHSGKVRRLASHPSLPVFATASSDRTIRLWDSVTKSQLDVMRTVDRPTCIIFASMDSMLVGNETGEIVMYAIKTLSASWQWSEDSSFHMVFKKNVGAKIGAGANAGVGKAKANKKSEVMDMKLSPGNRYLAVGCRDNLIHILDVQSNYKRLAVCRGHTSYIRMVDFSSDGAMLQSVDAARELLYWETSSGKQINNANRLRDLKWASWSCIYGWPVQGIFNGADAEGNLLEGDINALCRSNNGGLVVTGGSSTVANAIKLFRFPCLPASMPRMYGGHSSPVLDIAFQFDDAVVTSAGGNDTCLFQWQVIDS